MKWPLVVAGVAYLSIGQHRGIIALEAAFDELAHTG